MADLPDCKELKGKKKKACVEFNKAIRAVPKKKKLTRAQLAQKKHIERQKKGRAKTKAKKKGKRLQLKF